MTSQTSALILAAGFGTRLKPWTNELAKPLIPVAGVEALFYALYRVSKAGIKKTFVNAHYKADQIEAALKEYRRYFPELSITLSVEKEILGTGGGILKIIHEHKLMGGLLTLNGDTLSSLDLRPLIGRPSVFSVSYNTDFFKRYNPVYVDENEVWAGLKAKEGLRAAHILGAHYLSAEDLTLIRNDGGAVREIDLFSGIYELLNQNGRKLKAMDFLPSPSKEAFWFDLTNKDFLLEAKSQLSGAFFPLWRDVLEKRHPNKKREEAIHYWPLQSPQ
jgi:NDP-sugar pyrophosphorylase family protein